jgi:hypothetical protein
MTGQSRRQASVLVLLWLAVLARPLPAGAGKPECECRAFGRTFQIGEAVCLDGGLRVCGMSSNVTSWLVTGRSCPSA